MAKSNSVLLVSEYFYPHWTGISKSFYYIATNIIKQGYQVTVLTTQYDNKLQQQSIIDKVEVIRVPYQFRLSRTHYSLTIIARFIGIIGRYQTVIINSPNSNILLLSLISKIFRKKLIIYHQGDIIMPKKTGSQIVSRLLELCFDLLTIPSMFLADKVSTYSLDYAQSSRVMKHFTSKFQQYIPDIKLKSDPHPTKKLKEKIDNLKKNNYLVGFAGRFVEEKGFDILLKAIPLITAEIKNVKFVFAGKTNVDYEDFFSFLKPIINRNSNNLCFLGLLDDDDLNYFYQSITVFALPSRSDAFALTQLEAALNKAPIVVSDIAGARVLVKETGFGEIFQNESPKSLAEKIITVIKNGQKYTKNYSKVTQFINNHSYFLLPKNNVIR